MYFLRWSSLLLGILTGLIALPLHAAEIPEGVRLVTAPEVRMMLNNKETLLVHVLSHIEYKIQHIPTSINIPVNQVADSTKMPSAKDHPLIFYCNGVACPYSRRAAMTAVQRGYRHVYWFRGGILEWRKFQYDMAVDRVVSGIKVTKLRPEEFQEMIQGDVLVLDVRPKWWRQSKEHSGVIVGTEMMIPLLDLDQRLELLPKERPILLVDRLMRQSVHAAKFLQSKGYKVLGVLRGGAKRWVSEGRPVLQKELEPIPAADL